MEAVVKREIIDLGYEITEVEDGRVTFEGDAEAVCRMNICLRTAERLLIKLGSFKATSFEELYQGTRALPLEQFIPRDGRFWVAKAASIKSELFSVTDIQSVMKKAMVDRLGREYGVRTFEEDGAAYPIRVFIKKNIVTVGLDTSGETLHKRGYRKLTSKAPIAENLAAGLIMLTPWKGDRILIDPFCGSGTFPIEAAMMAANIAPGINRDFAATRWTNFIPAFLWREAREEAREEEDRGVKTEILGYDIDPEMVKISRENARLAGVDHLISFKTQDVSKLEHKGEYGFIITNPPYGERLEDERELPQLYSTIGGRYRSLKDWSMFLITSYDDAQRYLGRKADKNRKIYNGMIKTYFLQYMGAKPPKRGKAFEG